MKCCLFAKTDKLDKLIIKELLNNPSIQSSKISLKSGISLSTIQRRRLFIEKNLIKKRYFVDYNKLGFNFRFADVFVDIPKNRIDGLVRKIYKMSSFKNILNIMATKNGLTGSSSICIKAVYQISEELHELMDQIKSKPFTSNIHFSEEIELLGDNSVAIIMNKLRC
jgi:DNA-binding Lrp family transcriptional regulator